MGGGGGIAFVGKEARKLGLSVGPASRGLAAISDSTSHDGLRSPSIAAPSPISFTDALLSPPSQPRKWAMTTPISRKLAPGSLEDRPHVLTPCHFFPWPSDLVASPYLPLSPSLRLSNASGSPPFVFGKARVAVAVGLDVGTVRLIVSYRPFSQLTSSSPSQSSLRLVLHLHSHLQATLAALANTPPHH
ncbi:hypothetical protein EDB84DRAFT_1569969 [Lactarius hengduanensis]|nr:hypothetical protein EDB84DRAFT_1569969 [Lactarius hengduanensis]